MAIDEVTSPWLTVLPDIAVQLRRIADALERQNPSPVKVSMQPADEDAYSRTSLSKLRQLEDEERAEALRIRP